jgi:mRNA interferase RelE/StbE
MKVTLSHRAEKQLKKLSKTNQVFVAKKIRGLKEDQRPGDKEKLKGFKNIFRVRVGDYRIVYKKTKNLICVVSIAHRKDIYKLVKRLLNSSR